MPRKLYDLTGRTHAGSRGAKNRTLPRWYPQTSLPTAHVDILFSASLAPSHDSVPYTLDCPRHCIECPVPNGPHPTRICTSRGYTRWIGRRSPRPTTHRAPRRDPPLHHASRLRVFHAHMYQSSHNWEGLRLDRATQPTFRECTDVSSSPATTSTSQQTDPIAWHAR